MIASQVTITASSAALIATSGYGDPIILQNLGTGTLWVGGADTVDNTNGLKVATGDILNLSSWSGKVYGYAETNDCDVRVIEEKLG